MAAGGAIAGRGRARALSSPAPTDHVPAVAPRGSIPHRGDAIPTPTRARCDRERRKGGRARKRRTVGRGITAGRSPPPSYSSRPGAPEPASSRLPLPSNPTGRPASVVLAGTVRGGVDSRQQNTTALLEHRGPATPRTGPQPGCCGSGNGVRSVRVEPGVPAKDRRTS